MQTRDHHHGSATVHARPVPRRGWRPADGVLAPWLVVLAACVLVGCTTVPTREYTAYRQAWGEVRVSARGVFDTFAADEPDRQRVRQRGERARTTDSARARAEDEPADTARPAWTLKSVKASSAPASIEDALLVRYKALDVVDRYNEALLRLAEGKPAAELGASIGALGESIQSFPWGQVSGRVATAAGEALPYVGPVVSLLSELATEARAEGDRRRFVAGVDAASPLIAGLLKLMEEDAQDFANASRAVYESDTLPLVRAIKVEYRVGLAIVKARGGADKLDAGERAHLERLEKALRRVRDWAQADDLWARSPGDATAPAQGEQRAALERAAVNAELLAGRVEAVEDRLTRQERALTEFVVLVGELRVALEELRVASASAKPEAPKAEDLVRRAIRVRQAILAIEKAGAKG